MRRLKKRQKQLLIIIAIAIGVWFFWVNIILPFSRRWAEQSLELKIKKELLQKQKATIAEKETLNDKLSLLSKKIQAKLPLQREESQFLSEIGKVAQDTNVHIAGMHLLPVRDMGSFRELSVEIDMEANLGNVVRFLYFMRKSSVVLMASKLSLQPKSERSALLEGHLVISTIYLKKK